MNRFELITALALIGLIGAWSSSSFGQGQNVLTPNQASAAPATASPAGAAPAPPPSGFTLHKSHDKAQIKRLPIAQPDDHGFIFPPVRQ
jgi:hypothetical protein